MQPLKSNVSSVWDGLLRAASCMDANAMEDVMLPAVGNNLQSPGVMSLLYFFIVQDAVTNRISTPVSAWHATIPAFCRFILTHADELHLDYETLRDELRNVGLFPPLDCWEFPF
jgi:hypothetical protein